MIRVNLAPHRCGTRAGTAYTCQHCGKWFIPKTRDRVTFCSRDCSFAAGRKAKAERLSRPKPLPPERACEMCGATFRTGRQSKTCGPECRAERERVKSLEHYNNTKRVILGPRPCRQCGKMFDPTHGNHTAFHSKRCAARYGKAASGHKHRHRARIAGVEYEPVNVMRVLERDGWRCQVCGKPTPKNRRGTNFSNAPELDHRVPIALGGGHTYANTQCACRACNGRKHGNTAAGQLPMFPRGYPGAGLRSGTVAARPTPKSFTTEKRPHDFRPPESDT